MSGAKPLRRILVAGSGHALTLTVVSLLRHLQGLQVQLLAIDLGESEAEHTVVSTFASFHQLPEALELPGAKLAASLKAEPFAGCLINHPASDAPICLSDGEFGVTAARIPFHQLFHRYRHMEPTAQLDDFTVPSGNPGAGGAQGYKFLARDFQRYLKQVARAQDVLFIPSSSLQVITGAQGVESLVTESGQSLSADLYIDCSRSAIIMRAIQQSEQIAKEFVAPFARLDTLEQVGPQTTDRYSYLDLQPEQLSFRANYADCQYRLQLRWGGSVAEGAALTAPWFIRQAWQNNVVAMGAAVTNLPMILPGDYYLLHKQLLLLLNLLSGGVVDSVHSWVLSQQSQQMVMGLKDVVNFVMYYQAGNDNSLVLTEANRARVALFQSSGGKFVAENTVLSDSQWLALFYACGISQERGSLVSNTISDADLRTLMLQLKSTVKRA